MREDYRRWWRSAVHESPATTLDGGTDLLRESARRFIEIGTEHALISLVGQALAEQLELLAEKAWGSRAGSPDLMTGYGAMEEVSTMADIWSAAHDELTFDELLARHGYHGPDEGALTSRSWREDPTPLRRLVDRYKTSEVAHPRVREAEQTARREAAEARLLAGLNRADRAKAKLVMRMAKATIPMRELGKAGFLHGVDGARCAARLIGGHLVEAGFLDDVEDVFFLTYVELDTGIRGPAQELVAERRADHRRYEAMTVPASWTGNPVAVQTAPVTGDSTDDHAHDAGSTARVPRCRESGSSASRSSAGPKWRSTPTRLTSSRVTSWSARPPTELDTAVPDRGGAGHRHRRGDEPRRDRGPRARGHVRDQHRYRYPGHPGRGGDLGRRAYRAGPTALSGKFRRNIPLVASEIWIARPGPRETC